MLAWLFYTPLALLVYQLLLFPLTLIILARVRKGAEYPEMSDDALPGVAFIISARNEEECIAGKIENTLSLRYPRDKFRIIVAANGCSDRTAEIVRGYSDRGVGLLEYGEIGKTETQNRAAKSCREEIIVFSDANSQYTRDAVYQLVKPLQDKSIGCVAGNHIHKISSDSRGVMENLYWNKFEALFKRSESRSGGSLGAAGSIYAVRRKLYIPLPHDILHDFWEPVLIAARGNRTVFAEFAICYEHAENPDLRVEFRRKLRIVQQACYSLIRYRWILNPVRYPRLAWLITSHKLMRWLTPFLLGTPLIAASLRIMAGRARLPQYGYFISMSLFGFLALLGRGLGRTAMVPVLTPAYYAFLMSAAAARGMLTSLAGGHRSTWDRAR